MVNEGLAVFCTVMGMNGLAGFLVNQNDMFVLVDDVQLRYGNSQISVVLLGLLKKLIINIHLQNITALQAGISGRALAVDLDPFQPDVFLARYDPLFSEYRRRSLGESF